MTAPAPTQAQRAAHQQQPARIAVMCQRWAALAFYHWRINPETIATRLPAGLHVDAFDGSAWLGVVPFFMQRVRPTGLPPVPWLSWFLELNVRTYVYDAHGRAGVWFFSLDCDQPLAVEIARRFFHLPYEHATMRARIDADRHVHYECRRNSESDIATYHYPLSDPSVTRPATPGTLEWFLVERYLLFSANRHGRIFTGQVHHAPYRIAPIDADSACNITPPLAWDGLALPDHPPDSALVADAVDVKIFPLT